MNPRHLLAVVAAAAPLVCTAAEPPGAADPGAVQSPPPRFSQDQLQHIRNSLVGQIAAYDPAERAMRAPTRAEAAALSNTAKAGKPNVVRLARGGMALQGDMSTASFAVVQQGEDGTLVIGHGAARTGGTHAR